MSLRIFVQVWCEIDPTLNVRIDRQTGLAVAEPGDHLRRVSPLGRAGVAAAVKLGGAVTAFAIGTEHDQALRHALASGATRAVALLNDNVVAVPALSAWLARENPNLMIADRMAGLVASRLGWAHLAGLDELSIQGERLQAVRFLGRGDRELVSARLPAAVRLQSESIKPSYVCVSRLNAVADRPIENITLSGPATTDPGVGPLQETRARTRLSHAPSRPASGSASDRLQALMGGGLTRPPSPGSENETALPEQLAEEFVRYLLHHGLLPEE